MILYILLFLLFVVILANIRIVPQATEYVVAFLGKYRCTWNAGLHIKIPLLEKVVKKITLKEQVLDSPPQPVITKDNVSMMIDTVVFFKIYDAKLFTYGAVNPILALENLTATTLRNIVGDLELDNALTSRDTINGNMTKILDEATDQWGIKVTRVELKNIMPPKEIQQAMEKQMKAERDRRQTLLEAEGHRDAVITRAEGDKRAMILEAEGERDAHIAKAEGEAKAIELRRLAEANGLRALKQAGVDQAVLELKKYEALVKMADGKAAKIIVPADTSLEARRNIIFSETAGIGDTTKPAAEEKVEIEDDPCCERFEDNEFSHPEKSIQNEENTKQLNKEKTERKKRELIENFKNVMNK